ncbi:alpha/beta hydrolase [Synechococcus sp. RSCCF101]|nr:alpha/beta hydrolase [Synechococcus sp. RSCCF101]
MHPIGVGLSSAFWDRFLEAGSRRNWPGAVLLPDLLGCGASSCPRLPLTPRQWAEPLALHLRGDLQRPSLLLVQGASLPIALELQRLEPELVSGLVLFGPPAWRVMSQPMPERLARLLWNGWFSGPLGALFYRWARRRAFLSSFSERQLFARPDDVDDAWLAMLEQGAADMETRWAVFAFLAGFWRGDYVPQMTSLNTPVLALFGEEASAISRRGRRESLEEKAAFYEERLPGAVSRLLPGRNVLPWESASASLDAVTAWLSERRQST